MSKSLITRLFVGSVLATVAGVLLGFAAIWVAYASRGFVMDGPDVVGINGTGFVWTMIGLAVAGLLAILGGAIGGLVTWIGALRTLHNFLTRAGSSCCSCSAWPASASSR